MTSRRLVVALALLGLVAGLVLLVRGLVAYRALQRVAGIGTSRITSLAAGEVRLAGVVEADVMTLVSPLQSVPCVYFRSRIREGSGDDTRTVLDEERAVGFRLRDASGSIRVFPREARWDAPLRFDAASDWERGRPSRPEPQPGGVAPSRRRGPGGPDRRPPDGAPAGRPRRRGAGRRAQPLLDARWPPVASATAGPGAATTRSDAWSPATRSRSSGSALPFGDLDDPATADRFDPTLALDDPEVAMNLAEARAAGILEATPEEAWGNAAIPGFGIGRPARAPELDPEADVPVLASRAEATAAEVRFEIPPGELVVAAAPEHPLAIMAGSPGEAATREDAKVLLGMAGAALAIASAVVLALALPGAIPMSPIAGAALFAVLLVVIVALAVAVITYNAVVALRNRIDKAWGNVEVALRQRHDQLPALVDAVRDLMAFEQDVLEEVTRQRARYAPDAPVAEQGAVSAATTTAVRSLFAVVEAYPQVRSQENVLRLQGEIERLEGQLADRRELYNDQVYRYNTTIAQVPAVVLAALLGWRPRSFFDAGDAAEQRAGRLARPRGAMPGR